ncbi:MAG: hypothetical protein P8163_01485 [Candidatus Thiodiazotropha sp.]
MPTYALLSLFISTTICTQAYAGHASTQKNDTLDNYIFVYDENSLHKAFAEASYNPDITKIIFKRNSHITLTAPAIYSGDQPITLIGKGATIDGSAAGSYILDSDLTANTEDGTLIFDTASDVSINKLTIVNSATRGIVVNIPQDASGDDISINMNRVTVSHSALYGMHIDDNADAFDDGNSGSEIGIDLKLTNCTFEYNGIGSTDFDGIRVDERGAGDIYAFISSSRIDNNGGDGIELDEAGEGNVETYMNQVSLSGNGYYNEDDLEDGFDIDEADEGHLQVNLRRITLNNNRDKGLDFDEAGDGNIEVKLKHIMALNNTEEAIKLDEQDEGNIEIKLKKVHVANSGDDGIQLTELGEGKIDAKLSSVSAINNDKYGIKLEQWVIEDEDETAEKAGSLKLKKVDITDNGKGNEIKTNNIEIK